MDVIECDERHAAAWNEFVAENPACWHYHLYGWKTVIERAYRNSCNYLAAVNGSSIRGVLPLAVVKSRFFGKSVTSLPYLDTAGVAAAAPEARSALLERAVTLARDHDVDYLELRQVEPVAGDFRVDTHKVSLTRALEPTIEELWDSLPSERRNRVRKARKAGLTAETRGFDLLPRFYRVWSSNMRDLGSPVHSLRFFQTVLEVFPDSVGVLLIRTPSEDIGAAIIIEFKGTLAVPWVSSLRAHFALHPNDLLYWEAMKLALEHGHRRFDFGRSTEHSGNYEYKIRWGAQSAPLYWHYKALGRQEPVLPSEDRSRYGLAVQVWRHMPLAFTNWLGPKLRKQITS